jgi:NADPH:quinone reductase-like Zn-dependent oxidoreductase
MKAIVNTQYGLPDVLQLKEVERPTPKANQVLVKVHAASVNAGDWILLRGESLLVRLMAGGLQKPKNTILGNDIAGRVEAVGKDVTQFKVGEAVFGDISASGSGGFAEYVCVPETALAPKPINLSFEEAAAVPVAAITALQGLRDKGKLQPGQKVLVNGASGGVGTYMVQLAKAFGAEVTAVCSTRNLEMVRSLGADHVIDYTKQDFTQMPQRYDLIIAVNGQHSIFAYKRALTPTGTYVAVGGTMKQIFEGLLLGPFVAMLGKNKIASLTAAPTQKDLLALKALLEAGKLRPVIDRCYPLSETAEALRYLGNVHASGKVVITVAQDAAHA